MYLFFYLHYCLDPDLSTFQLYLINTYKWHRGWWVRWNVAQDQSLWSPSGLLCMVQWLHWSCWYWDSPLLKCGCYAVGNVLFRFHFHSWVTTWLELLCSCLFFFSSPASLSLSRFSWLRGHSAILMLPQRSQSSAVLSLPLSFSLPSSPPSVSGAFRFCAFRCCS